MVSKDDFESMFRRDVFLVSLDYLEGPLLTEQEVCENLKRCLSFFRGGAEPQVVRDFCIAKIRRERHMRGQAKNKDAEA